MSPWIENLIVIALILGALAYLLWKLVPRKGQPCSGGCCSMAKPKFPKT